MFFDTFLFLDFECGRAGYGYTRRREPENPGSSYIPIESWVYPAFDRLIALGLISDAYTGMRPWTRLQCANFVDEAEQRAEDLGSDADQKFNDDANLMSELAAEFREETRRIDGAANVGVKLDSV